MKSTLLAALSLALLHATAGWAQDSHTPRLIFNGFGTVGLVHSNEDQADFVSDPLDPEGAGHSSDLSPEVDSRLGLQLTADLTSRLSVVGQAIVEQRYDGTYTPKLEWANIHYAITPDLSVRAGRMVLPTFMSSDYRKVGYALPWIRPPQEVYSVQPITNIDGVELSYRFRFHGLTNTVRGSYGRNDVKLASENEVEARGIITLNNTVEWGGFSLFASYGRTRLTIDDFDPLFDAFRQFGPEGEAIAGRFEVDDTRFEVASIGALYDPGDWFVRGEWVATENRSFIADSRGWYLSGGYRFGTVTPYATLARLRGDSISPTPGLTLVGLPPPLAAQASGLNAGLNQLVDSAGEQRSLSAGVRWDFAPSFALKVQFDHLDLEDGSAGTLINEQPGFRRGGSVSLFSASIDFVF